MESIKDSYVLNNDVHMPKLGLGVYQTKDGDEVEAAVSSALDAGYQLIDTASLYGNEVGVGNAIRSSNVARSDIFVTTKLWNDDQGYDATISAFSKSMEKLNIDYLDLYLIHWPSPKRGLFAETWRAFEDLYKSGKVRAIGVSNFEPAHLDELMNTATIVPMVNQIELHPEMTQQPVVDYCVKNNIIVQSWSPIGAGKGLLDNVLLLNLAAKYSKTPAQIVIRWHIQHGYGVIPKSVHNERIIENSLVFDFKLSNDHMNQIDQLNSNNRLGPDPTTATF